MNIDTYNEILNRLTTDNPTVSKSILTATLNQAISEVETSNAKRSLNHDGRVL